MNIHQQMLQDNPRLGRGVYWCLKCGREQKFEDPLEAFKGWPQICCDEKMTVDSPEERAAAMPPPAKKKTGRRRYV